MRYVFLDTNAIVSDYRFRSAAMQVLLNRSRAGAIRLFLPEVAFIEAVGRYRWMHLDLVREIDSKMAALQRIRPGITHAGVPEPDDYGEWLSATLAEAAVRRPPPTHDWIELVQRANDRKPPFDSRGNGFRDAMIWDTISAVLNEKTPDQVAALITADGGFWEGSTLHPALSHEIGTGIEGFRTVTDFVRSSITQDAELYARVASRIEAEEGALIESLDQALRGLPVELGGSAYGDAHVIGIAQPAACPVVVEEIGWTTQGIEAMALLSVDLDLDIDVYAWDWVEEEHVYGSFTVTRTLEFTVVWDEETDFLHNVSPLGVGDLEVRGQFVD